MMSHLRVSNLGCNSPSNHRQPEDDLYIVGKIFLSRFQNIFQCSNPRSVAKENEEARAVTAISAPTDKKMEARSELKKNIYEIFKEFMTGITKLEELGNAANTFLLQFQQGLCFLQRPPMDTSSKLIENIIKKNETRRLISYIEAGCINIHAAAQSTRASQSLLIELEHLTDEASLAIKTVTQLDKDSRDELQQVTCDEGDETVQFPQGPQVTEYATLIALVYNMVKQNYTMQEKIVRSLSLKSSSSELETYSLMWSLRPFVEEEVMNTAWKLIY